MIIIRSQTGFSKIENNFNDEQAEQAFDYMQELEENGWTNVKWLHIPNLDYETYIKYWMSQVGGFFK